MTKKIVIFILSLCLIFTLAACNSGKNPSGNSSADNAGSFEKPEDYAVVLLAKLKPQIKLYIAENGGVLAVEAINDDAKQIVDGIKADGLDYQAVIKSFISAANVKGFLKDGVKIAFEIAEQKDTKPEKKTILENASLAAEAIAGELGISITVVTGDSDPNNTGTGTDHTNPSTEATVPPSNNPVQTEVHTHTFSRATCTEAAKCSCGATNGSALGHSWQAATCKAPKTCKTCGATNGSALGHSWQAATCNAPETCKTCGAANGSALGHSWQAATCKAPKTCKTCGATEGGKGDHTYTNGVCFVCGETTVLNPKTSLDADAEYIGNLREANNMLHGSALHFSEEGVCTIVDRQFTKERNDPNQEPIVFNGTNYYSLGGAMVPHNVELTDTEIIVRGSLYGGDSNDVTMKLTVLGNGMLNVTYSTYAVYPVGTILSPNINDVTR